MTGPLPSRTEPDGVLLERLRRLAEHAPPPRGAVTADRAIAQDRARYRRWAAWTAAALAIGGVLTAVPATVPSPSPGPAADGAAGIPAVEEEPSLYDVPTRGSLADDADFLAGVRALDWGDAGGAPDAGPPDRGLRPAEDTRRVLYAADVPGGSRWALVTGRVGRQLVHAWFTGPVGAAPGELVLAGGPARAGADQPIALLDAGGAMGPLVVVGRPGDRAEYSPSLDRDASGRLGRTHTELPVVDGVALGEVVTPVAAGAGQVRVLPVQGPPSVVAPMTAGDPAPVPVGPSPGQDAAQYWTALRDCLVPLGFQLVLGPGGAGATWSGGPALAPDVGALSSAEQAENDAASAQCLTRAAGR